MSDIATCPCGAEVEPTIGETQVGDETWPAVMYQCRKCRREVGCNAGPDLREVIEYTKHDFEEVTGTEEVLLSQIADLKARLRLRPMEEAPRDGTNICVRWKSRHVEGWISSIVYFYRTEKRWKFCGCGNEYFEGYLQAFWQDPNVFELPLDAFEVAL